MNPDLQQVDRLSGRWVEFAVAYAAACGHTLAIAGKNHRTGSQAVFVLEFALEHVRDDFHVAMRMRWKTGIGRDPIFVDDAQRAESHPPGIPEIVETESVVSLEPSVVSATTLIGATNLNHDVLRSSQHY